MKPTKNNDMETTIPNDHQTMPEDPNPMRQMMHYFSVPETPRDRIQPLGNKCKTRIPETPENPEIGEKSKNMKIHPLGIKKRLQIIVISQINQVSQVSQ